MIDLSALVPFESLALTCHDNEEEMNVRTKSILNARFHISKMKLCVRFRAPQSQEQIEEERERVNASVLTLEQELESWRDQGEQWKTELEATTQELQTTKEELVSQVLL